MDVPPADDALPHLTQALDAHVMARVFAALLPAGHRLIGCEIDRVKYRPRRNCSVSYRLRVNNEARGHAFEQLVATRWCSAGDAQRRWRKALDQHTVPSPAGPAVSHVAELGMVAHWAPNDAKLAAVRTVLDDAAMRERCLPDVVAVLTHGRGQLVDHRTTLVQLVPELRLCARVVMHVRRSGSDMLRRFTVYAKADLEHPAEATHAAMRALADCPAQAERRLRTATPLLWQADMGLHWQLHAAGRVLGEAEAAIDAPTSARVGAHLAALHATHLPGLRVESTDELQRSLQRTVDVLSSAHPIWAQRLGRMASRLRDGAAEIGALPHASLHGDLHAHNILVDGDALTFIDLDSICGGAAVIELGGWIAAMLHGALLDGRDPASTAPVWQAFLDAYAQHAGHRVDAHHLAWCTAHALLCTRAYRAVANLKPGRMASVPALVNLADAIACAGSIEAGLGARSASPQPAATSASGTTAASHGADL